MRIRVDKQFLLQFYILIREATRSLHSALSSDWAELRQGYPPEKINRFRQAIQEFARGFDLEAVDAQQSQAAANRLAGAEPNPFRVIFRSWLWRRTKTVSFGQEVRYMVCFLQQIADLLVADNPPQRETLIALRMQMSDVARIIQFRCCAIEDQPGSRMIWSVQDRAWRERHGLPLVYTTEDVDIRAESHGVAASAPSTSLSHGKES